MGKPDFESYLAGLSSLVAPAPPSESPGHAEIRAAAAHLLALPQVNALALSTSIAEHPNWVPALALVVGISQERLKNYLKHQFGSAAWASLAKNRSGEIVQKLDKDYGLVAQLMADRSKLFTLGDILVARAGTRQTAGQSVKRGRRLEDDVEEVVQGLGLPYATRTQFSGAGKDDLPCDIAIPGGGKAARIVCAVKGFNSTGSKLSDAVKEIRELADYRKPTQFIYAIVDGIGWLSRKSDLRSIFSLWEDGSIDGMYSLTTLNQFKVALSSAARLAKIGRAAPGSA